jgi:hypothetical protein
MPTVDAADTAVGMALAHDSDVATLPRMLDQPKLLRLLTDLKLLSAQHARRYRDGVASTRASGAPGA